MEYLDWSESAAFRRRLAGKLKAGAIVMMPTDTVYGLVARADDQSAVRRVFDIKRRNRGKALLVLVSSMNMVEKYCRLNGRQRESLRGLWMGRRPITAILPHRNRLPRELTGEEDGLAVRLPKTDFLRKMIRAVGAPLIATSANQSGQPVLDADSASLAFRRGPKPDLVVRGGNNRRSVSRLVLIKENGGVTVIRP
ncbi:MAG: L-threonylcarbamoyladenylate synthase [Bacillota bacterium]